MSDPVLRVLSYNILRPIWAKPHWPDWTSRCGGVARVIRDAHPHVVALQEETAEMVEDLLRPLPGYRYLHTNPDPSSGSGLLVHEDAPEPGSPVRIDLPGGRVANFWPMLEGERCWVGCTHFYPFPQAELVEMRSESARRVLAWWSEQPSNDRMLLMGDYNSLPDDPAVDLFLAAGFRDAIPPGVDGRPSRAATAHEFLEEGGWRLDYLFHSPGWKVLHADILHPKPAPSDHHPLFAEIKPQAGSD